MPNISAEEQQAAEAILRRQQNPGQFPGTATSRLHGRYATLGLAGGAASLLCFHWEVEFMQDFADATAHGDFWRVRLPLTMDWQGRVQGYLTHSGASYLATSGALAADPAVMTLTVYSDENPGGTGHKILVGDCYVQRGRVLAPMAMVTQELELVSAYVPTTLA